MDELGEWLKAPESAFVYILSLGRFAITIRCGVAQKLVCGVRFLWISLRSACQVTTPYTRAITRRIYFKY